MQIFFIIIIIIVIIIIKSEADDRVDSTVCVNHVIGDNVEQVKTTGKRDGTVRCTNPRGDNKEWTKLSSYERRAEWNYNSSKSIHCYQNQALNRYYPRNIRKKDV